MASTAKVVSLQAAQPEPELRAVAAPAPRRDRWGWLRLVREAFGGALLLAVWIALWTVTWAAIAGPLAPGRNAPTVSIEARI